MKVFSVFYLANLIQWLRLASVCTSASLIREVRRNRTPLAILTARWPGSPSASDSSSPGTDNWVESEPEEWQNHRKRNLSIRAIEERVKATTEGLPGHSVFPTGCLFLPEAMRWWRDSSGHMLQSCTTILGYREPGMSRRTTRSRPMPGRPANKTNHWANPKLTSYNLSRCHNSPGPTFQWVFVRGLPPDWNKAIFAIVDHFTEMGHSLSTLLFNHVFRLCGVPVYVVLDRGS